MESPNPQLALLRFSGDIGTKARATRSRFVRRLLANVRDALATEGITASVRVIQNRVFVEFSDRAGDSAAHIRDVPALRSGVAALTRVFGIQSISFVERQPASSVDEVARFGEDLFRERVAGRRFAVRARRVGDRSKIALLPSDIERELGARLLPGSAGVDLSHPEETVHVELIEAEAFFFPERIPGCGGIPLGEGGQAIALISGGFDSAVAAWQLLRRGVCIDYAFCNLGGETHQQGVLRVAKVLASQWSYGDRPRLHAIDFEPLSEELRARCRSRYWQVILKRMMLRAAELVAHERRAMALITGEAVGQVSSQTLPNLAVISRATTANILRPLVGSNKEEIIDTARKIGTFELSKVVGEYCAMVPTRPATAANLRVIEAEEAKFDISLVEAAVAGRTVFDLSKVDIERLGFPDLEIERIPEAAIVIDLRSDDEYRNWHWPGALRLDFSRALNAYPSFDKTETYVLYCEIGLKSAHLAEFMRKAGFEAFHVRGGMRTLKKLSTR